MFKVCCLEIWMDGFYCHWVLSSMLATWGCSGNDRHPLYAKKRSLTAIYAPPLHNLRAISNGYTINRSIYLFSRMKSASTYEFYACGKSVPSGCLAMGTRAADHRVDGWHSHSIGPWCIVYQKLYNKVSMFMKLWVKKLWKPQVAGYYKRRSTKFMYVCVHGTTIHALSGKAECLCHG